MTSQSNQRTLNISTRGGSSNRGGRRSNQSTTLTADQRHQIELVQSIKPEWEKEQVASFCEEHNYNGDAIQSAIAQLFEFDRPAHAAETEEWKTIPSQQRKAEGSPTNAARVAGRGARGGRGGATRGGATLSDRSINAQSVTNDQKFARGQPSGRGRDNRGSSPTNEDDADKKKYKKVEKPAVTQVQLPVAGKSYAASLGLAKQPAAPVAQPAKDTKPDETDKSETVQSKPVVDTPAAIAPVESIPQQQTSQPEATPAPAAVPAVQPAKTAAQIVAAGPKKPAPKQPVAAPTAAPTPAAVAAPAPTPVAAPVSTPAAVVSEEKNDEPKVASQSTPSPSSTATTAAAKPAVSAGRMWRKKESSTSSPANTAATASSPAPIAATAEPVAEQSSVSSFATAPLASLSQSIQAALKPASPQVRPASPQQAPKSPAHIPAAVEKTHAPAPSSSPVPQSVADLLSAHDAVILPQHLRTVDADVQFGFGGKSTGPRAGGPRAPQPKAAPQAQSQVQQPASPVLNAHSQSALGSFPQTVNAGRFPGSTSPLIHGLNSAATEQSKAVSSSRPAGVAGLTPSTPQNLPLSSQNQTPQTQASMDSSVHVDEYGSLQNQQDLHSNDYSQHNESHHDETGLANNLAHLNTSAGSYAEGDQQYNYLGNMDALSSPPTVYDPSAMGGYGYDQFQMGNDYSMYSGYGDYNQNNMGFQQRGMGGPNKRGGFMPQNRGQSSQSYNNYRGPQQSYQQQQPINKPQSNMPQQPKKYQQSGPGAIQQPQQQQQQPNAAIGRPPVNQTAKSPQPNTVQPQNQAPQQMMNTARPMQSQSPNPTQYNDYSRQSYNKQNNAPVGQQQYQSNQNAQPAYNAQPKAPHSPQSSYKPHQGPNKSYNKPNQYPQQQQQYNNNAPNYNQAPFNPLQNYHNPYGYAPQYPPYANQFPVGGVPSGPPGFGAGRGYPGTSGVQGFPAPFHGQSGYSSPQNFGGEYDLQSNMNDPYAKQQFSGHVGDQSLVDPSQAQSGSAQSMGDASAWQSNPNQPKKVVGPESDPAAQRLGPYQNLPFNQQGSSPYNHSMSFGAAPQQHQPLYSNPQQYQPPQQQPQQHYQQQQSWQPHM